MSKFMGDKTAPLLAVFSAAILCFFVALLVADEVDAQRRGFGGGGGGFRGGFGRGSSGGYGGFRSAPRFPPARPSAPIRRPSAPSRMMPQQGIPGGSGGKWPLPKSIHPNSPVTSMQRFTGQATKAGSPIVETAKGKRYAVPQKGVSTSLNATSPSADKANINYVSGKTQDKITKLSLKSAFNTASSPNGNPNRPYRDELGKAPAKRSSPTVIGHFPSYAISSEWGGYRRFQIDKAHWEKTEMRYLEEAKLKGEPEDKGRKRFEEAMWKGNERFLERTVRRGDRVFLATSLSNIKKDSYLSREVAYLTSKGYRLNATGTILIPPKE